MSEERSNYHAMSVKEAADAGIIVTSAHGMELADEVKQLKQRQRELCVLMGWLRGRITWDAAGRMMGFNPDTASFRQYGRLELMVDAAINEGKRIVEEAQGEVV